MPRGKTPRQPTRTGRQEGARVARALPPAKAAGGGAGHPPGEGWGGGKNTTPGREPWAIAARTSPEGAKEIAPRSKGRLKAGISLQSPRSRSHRRNSEAPRPTL